MLFAPVQWGTAGAIREEVGKAETGKESAAKNDLFHIHAGLLQIVTGKLKALIWDVTVDGDSHLFAEPAGKILISAIPHKKLSIKNL